MCKICSKTKKSATDTYYSPKTTFGDKYLSRSNVFIWFNKIKNDRESIDDDSSIILILVLIDDDKPPNLISRENLAKIRNLVRSDRRLTSREIVYELNWSFYEIWSILTK